MSRTIYLITILLFLSNCSDKKEADGKKVNYDNKGNVISVLHYKNGKLNGDCVWFYSDGRYKSLERYINDEKEGHAYTFYQSGALESRGVYVRNKRVGYSEVFWDHSVGFKKFVDYYDNTGKLISRYTYDEENNIVKEQSFQKQDSL